MDDNWKLNIHNSIKDIADIEKQRRVWLGADSQSASSFDEDMSLLFDSFCFEEFLQTIEAEQKSNNEFIIKLKQFYAVLDDYDKKKTDYEILEDSKWHEIVQMAKEIIASWRG